MQGRSDGGTTRGDNSMGQSWTSTIAMLIEIEWDRYMIVFSVALPSVALRLEGVSCRSANTECKTSQVLIVPTPHIKIGALYHTRRRGRSEAKVPYQARVSRGSTRSGPKALGLSVND